MELELSLSSPSTSGRSWYPECPRHGRCSAYFIRTTLQSRQDGSRCGTKTSEPQSGPKTPPLPPNQPLGELRPVTTRVPSAESQEAESRVGRQVQAGAYGRKGESMPMTVTAGRGVGEERAAGSMGQRK